MLELIGLVAGLLIGAFFPWTIPAQWSRSLLNVGK